MEVKRKVCAVHNSHFGQRVSKFNSTLPLFGANVWNLKIIFINNSPAIIKLSIHNASYPNFLIAVIYHYK